MVGHEFWLSALCLLGFAISRVGVPEASLDSAKDNVPQVVALAGARIDQVCNAFTFKIVSKEKLQIFIYAWMNIRVLNVNES